MTKSNNTPGVIDVDVNTAKAWFDDDEILLVDVREVSEYDQEHIPGARLMPLSVFDPKWLPDGTGIVFGAWLYEEQPSVDATREEVVKTFTSKVPLGRLASLADVSNLTCFLCSDAAEYMTGQAVNVTGGREMH